MTATQSYVTYIGNGVTTDFTFSFPYLEREHIIVLLDEVETTAFTFAASGTIRLNTAPATGVEIIIRRQTPKNSALLEIQTKSTLKSSELNAQILQTLYASQEAVDTSELIRAGGLTIPSVEQAKDDAEAAKDLAIIAQGLAEAARDVSVDIADDLTNTVDNANAATLAANTAASNAQTIANSLSNVDNTADIDKPVSTLQAAAIATKLPLVGGTLTGNLTAPALLSSASKSDTPMSNLFIRDQGSWFGMRHSTSNDLCIDVNNSGSAVNALKVNQDGIVLKPNHPVFSADSAPAYTVTSQMVFGAAKVNQGNHYNTATGVFTAPVSGKYYFNVYCMVNMGASASAYGIMNFVINGVGRNPILHSNHGYTRNYEPLTHVDIVSLTEGDTLYARVDLYNGAYTFGPPYNSFKGFLIG